MTKRRHYDDPPLLKKSGTSLSKKQSLVILTFVAIVLLIAAWQSVGVEIAPLLAYSTAIDTSDMSCSKTELYVICVEKSEGCRVAREGEGIVIICEYGFEAVPTASPTETKPNV